MNILFISILCLPFFFYSVSASENFSQINEIVNEGNRNCYSIEELKKTLLCLIKKKLKFNSDIQEKIEKIFFANKNLIGKKIDEDGVTVEVTKERLARDLYAMLIRYPSLIDLPLDRLVFHASNSSSLTIFTSFNHYEGKLLPTGKLIELKRTPFTGELDNGVQSINQNYLSVLYPLASMFEIVMKRYSTMDMHPKLSSEDYLQRLNTLIDTQIKYIVEDSKKPYFKYFSMGETKITKQLNEIEEKLKKINTEEGDSEFLDFQLAEVCNALKTLKKNVLLEEYNLYQEKLQAMKKMNQEETVEWMINKNPFEDGRVITLKIYQERKDNFNHLSEIEKELILNPFPVYYAIAADRDRIESISHSGVSGELLLKSGTEKGEIHTIFVPQEKINLVQSLLKEAQDKNPQLTIPQIKTIEGLDENISLKKLCPNALSSGFDHALKNFFSTTLL